MEAMRLFIHPTEQERFVPIEETKKNYNGIDLVKFVCAIMVFIIHIPPFQGEISGAAEIVNYGLQHYLCRLAVPFYFISSGFFLFKRMPLYSPDQGRIRAYCYKILRLLGIWHVLLWIGDKGHLWYLGATVIAVILVSLCFHFRIRLGYICALAGVLYVIGLLGDSYYGVIAPLENIAIGKLLIKGYMYMFKTTRNGVFMGFIYVLIGAVLSNCKIRFKTGTSVIGLAVSMLFLFAEVFLLRHYHIPIENNMYVFLLPASFFLFSLAVSVELKDRPIYAHLRSIGMMIYFIHLLVNALILLAIGIVDRYFGTALGRYTFIFTLLFTVLIAIFADLLSYKKKFHWINWLIS